MREEVFIFLVLIGLASAAKIIEIQTLTGNNGMIRPSGKVTLDICDER